MRCRAGEVRASRPAPTLLVDPRGRVSATAGAPKPSRGRLAAAWCRNVRWPKGVDSGMVVRGGHASRVRPTTEHGGERFRLRWLIQEKRAEGDGCDLVNHATVNQ